MLKITNILNPLTGESATTEHVWESGRALSEYIGYDGECIIACGREIVSQALDQIFPARNEEYLIMAVPEGVDRQTWRILGTMAMAGIAFIPGWGVPAAFIGATLITLFLQDKDKGQALSDSYAWQHRSNPTAAQGAAMPIVYGKARVRPTLKNRYITVKGDKQALYTLYGLATHKVDETTYPRWNASDRWERGSIVRTPLEEDADEPGKTYTNPNNPITGVSYLNEKFWEVGHGTASFANDILVNGRAIEDFHDDVEWETRPGLPEQTVIIGFDVTYSNFVQDTVLYLDYPEINKKTANFRLDNATMTVLWDEHQLTYHGVLYTIRNGTVSLTPAMIGEPFYFIYDTAVSTTVYQTSFGTIVLPDTAYVIFSFTVGVSDWSDKEWPYITNLPKSGDWFSPVITIAATHNIEVMFEFPYGLYSSPAGENMVSSDCRLFAQYREVDADRWLNFSAGFSDPDHLEDYADSDIQAVHVTRKKPELVNISLKAVGDEDVKLTESKSYEVRVTASSPSIIKIINIATIVYGEENIDTESSPGFTYPGEPLLGIKALASGQISGDLDVQVDVERSKVWVYNTRTGGGWVKGNANNHAWAVYDILAQGHPDHPAYPTASNDDAEAIYGCGIDKDRLDYESFRTWAENVGDLDYELNIVFDAFVTAWDAILKICQEGRGMVYPVGTKIYAFADMATDVSQVFTMGNIHLGTFTQRYMEENQKINVVEVNYYDRDRDYQKTTIAARTADWDSSTKLSIPATLTLYGTTTFDQAWSIARFILMGNELLDNIISFGVDVDALAAQAGDVVEVQHDVLTTGQGGRIVEVVHNSLLNGSFESALLPSWIEWSPPNVVYGRSTNQAKYGVRSLHTRSTNDNGGGQQTFTVNPSTEYTLSCWVYMLNVLIPTATIRAMTLVTGAGSHSKALANTSLLNQWQRVSVTFTTAAGQTTATVWLGGIGEAYFDGVMFNAGATADDFILGTKLTMDRTLSDVVGEQYRLTIYNNNGNIETQTGITHGNISGSVITFGEDWSWDTIPSQYEPYAIGISGVDVRKYRIADISRTNELMRTLTLVQYDEGLYASYVPSDPISVIAPGEFSLEKIATSDGTVETLANLLNLATNLQLQEVLSKNRTTGEYESSIVATWDTVLGDPRGSWEVWFRDVDGSDVDWQGAWAQGTYQLGQKVEHDGKTYISLEDDNASRPINV